MPITWTDFPPEIRSHIVHHVVRDILSPEVLEDTRSYERSLIVEPQLDALTQVSYVFGSDCVHTLRQVKLDIDREDFREPRPRFWKGLWNDGGARHGHARMIVLDRLDFSFGCALETIAEREARRMRKTRDTSWHEECFHGEDEEVVFPERKQKREMLGLDTSCYICSGR